MNGEKREKVGAPAMAGRLQGRQSLETREVVGPDNLSFAIAGIFRYHREQEPIHNHATSLRLDEVTIEGEISRGDTLVSAGFQVAASLAFGGLNKRLTLGTKRKVKKFA